MLRSHEYYYLPIMDPIKLCLEKKIEFYRYITGITNTNYTKEFCTICENFVVNKNDCDYCHALKFYLSYTDRFRCKKCGLKLQIEEHCNLFYIIDAIERAHGRICGRICRGEVSIW